MFNPFVWLDSIVLHAAQKFCDKFQRLTGFTKFKLQKWSLILSIAFNWGQTIVFEFNVVFIFCALVYNITMCANLWLEEKAEIEFLASENLIDHSIWRFTSVRTILLFSFGVPSIVLLFFGAVALITIGFALFFLAWIYFSACVPRPPSKSKMREWCEKALIALNNSLKPAPALVPITIPCR